jgi:hypothetical protein
MAIQQQKKDLGIPAVYLISYADGHDVFLRNQNNLASAAINKGIDFIYNYRRDHLDPKFVKKNRHILNQKRGAGYWLWKPYLILKTLREIPEGSVLIYADVGYTLPANINNLLNIIGKGYEIILPQWPFHTIKMATKREVLIKMYGDKIEGLDVPHVEAGAIILKNTKQVREFIQQWLKYCEEENLITDSPSSKPEHSDFLFHRHDQSILSVLNHIYPNKDIIYVYNHFSLRKDSFYLHYRHAAGGYKILRSFKGQNVIDRWIEKRVTRFLGSINKFSQHTFITTKEK